MNGIRCWSEKREVIKVLTEMLANRNGRGSWGAWKEGRTHGIVMVKLNERTIDSAMVEASQLYAQEAIPGLGDAG
jgi:hypothetical protein